MTTALTTTIDTLITNLEALSSSIEAPLFNDARIIAKVQTLLTQLNLDTSTINERVYEQRWTNPDAAAVDNAATQNDLNAKDQTDCPIAVAGEAQADYARNIYVTGTDLIGATSVVGTITGTDRMGVAMTEEFTVTTAAKVWTGTKAFYSLVSIVVDTITGTGGASDTLDFGYGVLFGLIGNVNVTAPVKTNMDEDADTAAAMVVATNTVEFDTAPNATHDYQLWYVGRA